MILRDRVNVDRRVKVGEDAMGEPSYEDQEVPYRAEVWPLSSSENVATGQQVTTRFRIVLGPDATDVTAADAIAWRGRQYEVEGNVEPHLVMGRLHHHELVAHRVAG